MRTGLTSLKLFPDTGSGVHTTQAGTNYSIPVEIGDCQDMSFQLDHTAAVSGTVNIQFSNHPQPVVATYRSPSDTYFTTLGDAGWVTDSTLSQTLATTTSGSVMFQFSRVGARWVRIKLSNTNSNTNTRLSGFANGKG